MNKQTAIQANSVTSKRIDSRRLLLLFPFIFLVLFLLVPFFYTCWTGVFQGKGNVLEVIKHVITVPLYRKVFLNTIWISLWVTISTLFLGYPIAFFISHTSPRREKIILSVLVSSMWLSILIRSYAWIIILQRKGPLNDILAALGIIDQPVTFMFSRFSVILGMTHILLPYMVLVIWTSIKGFGWNFEKVAYSLGATKTFYFFKVFLPHSLSGIIAGVLLVFLLSIGFYISPALLGGGSGDTMMIAMLIEERMNTLGDWNMGAVLAILLLLVIIVPMAVSWFSKTIRNIWQRLFSGAAYET